MTSLLIVSGFLADDASAAPAVDPLRPQFHYTVEKGFVSDPNGLVHYKGEYHLFHQTNPNDCKSGVPQHWGHAISTDLVHWSRQPIAIHPHDGGNIWSGSAVVDWKNSSGLQKGDEPPMVAFYTWQKDFSQRLVYSNDRGRTWMEYDRNPVLPNIAGSNRDPKVFWHEPTKQWIMVLYVKEFEIFSSTNLLDWKPCSTMTKPAGECPDMFELPVDGNPHNKKWVVVGADGRYNIGSFDGKNFTKESGPHRSCYSKEGLFYATQTWSDVPAEDGRCIQIACLRSDHTRKDRKVPDPDTAFCNLMTFPCELTLRATDDAVRLFREPASEIENLYSDRQTWKSKNIRPGARLDLSIGELFDMTVTINPLDATNITFANRGLEIKYREGRLYCMVGNNQQIDAPFRPGKDGRLKLRILKDRTCCEIFGNDGQISLAAEFKPIPNDGSCYITAEGGIAEVESLRVNSLKSMYQ